MSRIVRRAAGDPLNEEEQAQLRTLAQKLDSEIDFSDLPERIYSVEDALKPHTVTLQVEDEVAAWLEQAGARDATYINNALKREAQRSKLRAKADEGELLQKAS